MSNFKINVNVAYLAKECLIPIKKNNGITGRDLQIPSCYTFL